MTNLERFLGKPMSDFHKLRPNEQIEVFEDAVKSKNETIPTIKKVPLKKYFLGGIITGLAFYKLRR